MHCRLPKLTRACRTIYFADTKQSCAVFSAVSCQNRIASNVLFHGPRAMMNLNDGFGGDTVIERNLLFGAMLETSDHGPFNS